jgi:hypothetical protein
MTHGARRKSVVYLSPEAEVMANESSAVSYCLECLSCGHEWFETEHEMLDSCPKCGVAVEKTSGSFRLDADVSAPTTRRPSGSWGWAEATQNKP